MVWKAVTYINIIVLWCVVAVTARPSKPSYATSEQKFVQYFNKNEEKIISRTGSGEAGDHEEYFNSYPSYEFSYKVKDPHTHDIKGQQEKRHGDKVNGDYWLLEPDGRKRIVKYHANDKIGFKVLIDYLKQEGHRLIPNNDEKKPEQVEEEIVELPPVESETDTEKNQSAEENVQEEGETNQSIEGENHKSEPDEVKEEQHQNDNQEDEQIARDKGNSVYSSVKIQKVIKPRLIIRINENNSDISNKKKERPQESSIAKEKNMMGYYVRKDWSMKKEKPKVSKPENENNVKEDAENIRENTQPQNKGYEVTEQVIENISENNNVEQETRQPEEEIKIVAEKATESVIEANENKKDGKINKPENEENKEDVYAYKTFICHPRY